MAFVKYDALVQELVETSKCFVGAAIVDMKASGEVTLGSAVLGSARLALRLTEVMNVIASFRFTGTLPSDQLASVAGHMFVVAHSRPKYTYAVAATSAPGAVPAGCLFFRHATESGEDLLLVAFTGLVPAELCVSTASIWIGKNIE